MPYARCLIQVVLNVCSGVPFNELAEAGPFIHDENDCDFAHVHVSVFCDVLVCSYM